MSADEVEKLAREMIEACADPESSEGAERYAALLVRAREVIPRAHGVVATQQDCGCLPDNSYECLLCTLGSLMLDLDKLV